MRVRATMTERKTGIAHCTADIIPYFLLSQAVERQSRAQLTRLGPTLIRETAQLFDTHQQAVIGTTLAGEIVYWNEAAERLYGWPAEQVLGRDIVAVTPSLAAADRAAEIMDRLRRGYTWEGEFLVRNRAGKTFRVQVVDLPVRDTRGELIGIVGTSYALDEAAPEG